MNCEDYEHEVSNEEIDNMIWYPAGKWSHKNPHPMVPPSAQPSSIVNQNKWPNWYHMMIDIVDEAEAELAELKTANHSKLQEAIIAGDRAYWAKNPFELAKKTDNNIIFVPQLVSNKEPQITPAKPAAPEEIVQRPQQNYKPSRPNLQKCRFGAKCNSFNGGRPCKFIH